MSTLTLKKDSTTTATYSYTYDDSGNITGKYVYAYTTGTLPSTYQDHISYGYSTGAWGDMLTSYDAKKKKKKKKQADRNGFGLLLIC